MGIVPIDRLQSLISFGQVIEAGHNDAMRFRHHKHRFRINSCVDEALLGEPGGEFKHAGQNPVHMLLRKFQSGKRHGPFSEAINQGFVFPFRADGKVFLKVPGGFVPKAEHTTQVARGSLQ